jgi:hypothetical protein
MMMAVETEPLAALFRHCSLGYNDNQIASAINAGGCLVDATRENISIMRRSVTVPQQKIFSTKSPKPA